MFNGILQNINNRLANGIIYQIQHIILETVVGEIILTITIRILIVDGVTKEAIMDGEIIQVEEVMGDGVMREAIMGDGEILGAILVEIMMDGETISKPKEIIIVVWETIRAIMMDGEILSIRKVVTTAGGTLTTLDGKTQAQTTTTVDGVTHSKLIPILKAIMDGVISLQLEKDQIAHGVLAGDSNSILVSIYSFNLLKDT